jgi:proteasome lid subunit RPN8/RPN11
MKKLNLSSAQIAQISKYCESIYPEEACGLLVGERHGGNATVDRVIFAQNISDRPCKNFEIDPETLIDTARLMRQEDREILGHFHSHPDQSADASKTDEGMTYDKSLYWIIVSVMEGAAKNMNFYEVDQRHNQLFLMKNIDLF